jgi:Uncharacterized protein conserved in bacteria
MVSVNADGAEQEAAEKKGRKITPFLWFDNNAEEAVNFYVSVFKNSKINNLSRYGQAGPGPNGSVMTIDFQLEGEAFIALNGGPHFTFTPAISFVVNCDSQQELDELWDKLSTGGEEVNCGWLKDKYGLSWQIVPAVLGKLMSSGNQVKTQNVTKALMQMVKLDLKGLEDAYNKE